MINRIRLRAIALGLLLPVAVLACGGGGDDDSGDGALGADKDKPATERTSETTSDDASTEFTTTTLPPPETVKIGKTAFHGDFEIKVESATFTPLDDEGAGNLAVTVRLTNLSEEILTPDWQAWSMALNGSDLTAQAAFPEDIPAGGSNELEVGWYIPERFAFDDAIVAFGEQGANQAHVPLGDGEADGLEPFTVAASGAIALSDSTVSVHEARFSPNYDVGKAGKYNLRLPVTLDAVPTPGGLYAGNNQFTLLTPKGDSVVGLSLMTNYRVLCCEVLTDNPLDSVLAFEVDEPVDGTYTLTYANGPGETGSVTFNVSAPS